MVRAELYYHVTPADRLPRIRDEGIVPSADWAGYGPDDDPEEVADMARVFVCDSLRGAERYRGFIGKSAPAVVLVVPGDALTDIEPDEAMTGDCYVVNAIQPELIEILHADGSREPLNPASPKPR